MDRVFLAKRTFAAIGMIVLAASLSLESRAGGWFSRTNIEDCGPTHSWKQIKAEIACEWSASQQLTGLSCGQLRCLAESQRQMTNARALATYQSPPWRVGRP